VHQPHDLLARVIEQDRRAIAVRPEERDAGDIGQHRVGVNRAHLLPQAPGPFIASAPSLGGHLVVEDGDRRAMRREGADQWHAERIAHNLPVAADDAEIVAGRDAEV
jgi:hypothetical protein